MEEVFSNKGRERFIMKKVLFSILALLSCFTLTGCLEKKEQTSISQPVSAVSNNDENIENNPKIEEVQGATSKEAIEAIKSALKDDEWVKKNVMMQKTCFGEDASYEDQELTFAKLGKDRVIVQAFAYEKDFGISNTVVAYQDGKVVTMGLPTIEEPNHPGHVGYGIVPNEEILVESYMHMGYYIDKYYKILDNKFDLLASFEASEYGEDGVLLEDESNIPLVDYQSEIDGKKVSGRTTFEDFEKKVMEYMDTEKIESIEIPLTAENVELYLK